MAHYQSRAHSAQSTPHPLAARTSAISLPLSMNRAASLRRCLPYSKHGLKHTRTIHSQQISTFPIVNKPLTVLAFETSADDTCAAVVDAERKIHANVVLRQNDVHAKYSGIHPQQAIFAHTRLLPLAAARALHEAGLKIGDIDGVAFTQGPGMGGCLAVGCNAAKTLAAVEGKGLVGVNHMRAHALTITLTHPDPPPFPHLTLLVSGGHTMLVLVHSPESYELVGETVDEALGETFDRVAHHLGLGWGEKGLGAALEQCASAHVASTHVSASGTASTWPEDVQPAASDNISLPRRMPGQLTMSFCGLRSATKRLIDGTKAREGGELSPASRGAIAAKFQEAAVAQLEDKLEMAIKECRRRGVMPSAIVASGGVASNKYLRSRLHLAAEAAHAGTGEPLQVYYPPLELCTDNAAMIAWASMGRFLRRGTDPLDLIPLRGWKIDMDRDKVVVEGS